MVDDVMGNSLSRYAEVYICNDCGVDEAMRELNGTVLPRSDWWSEREVL